MRSGYTGGYAGNKVTRKGDAIVVALGWIADAVSSLFGSSMTYIIKIVLRLVTGKGELERLLNSVRIDL
jgi:hypothetical protein